MRKSLMVMMVMGLLAMVFMAAMGSFFVGKVGNAEHAGTLRRELATIFGHQMHDRDQLKLRVVKNSDGAGIVVSFTPAESLERDRGRCDRQIRRLANHILGQDEWRSLDFVEVQLSLPGGEVRESRFDRSSVPALPE